MDKTEETLKTEQQAPPAGEDKTKMGMGHRMRDDDIEKDDYPMAMASDPSVMGATSFADVIEAERATEAAKKVRKRAGQVPELVEGIFQNPLITDKGQAIADLGPEFGAVVAQEMADAQTKERWQPLTDAVVKALSPLLEKIGIKEEAHPETPPDTKAKGNSFTYWKQKNGRYRWLATYSNKFIDEDIPPEIIAERSHKRFVEMVNKGIYPYPELWLWHVDGSRWGVADFVGYDDRGFAVATGLIDEGKEWIAKSLPDDILTSHGMPRESVKRDPQDPSIIIEHRTREISPLPSVIAANKFTDFSILGEDDMAFPEQDREKLKALNVDPDRLEESNEEKAKQTEGMKFKETQEDAATEAAGSGADDQPDYVDRDEVAELVKSIATSTNQLTQVVGQLVKRIETLEENKLALTKETLERTPAASLADIYKSVIGSEEAKLDGRTALAKSGPEETPPEPATGPGSRFGGGIASVILKRNREIEAGHGGVQ